MQIFEYLFGILSEILMCEIILLDYWGILTLLKLLRNFGVCGIHLHHGYVENK